MIMSSANTCSFPIWMSFFKYLILAARVFSAALGLQCCAGSSVLRWVFPAARGLSALVAESRGHSGGAVLRLLAAGEPRLREHGLQ